MRGSLKFIRNPGGTIVFQAGGLNIAAPLRFRRNNRVFDMARLIVTPQAVDDAGELLLSDEHGRALFTTSLPHPR